MLLFAGLKTHYAVELEVRDGVVFARSKPDIDPATKWSRAKQIFPPVLRPQTRAHSPEVIPDTCVLQEWSNVGKVKTSLRQFYILHPEVEGERNLHSREGA